MGNRPCFESINNRVTIFYLIIIMKTLAKITLCAIVLTFAAFLLFQKRDTGRASRPGKKETAASQTPRPVPPALFSSGDEPAGPANSALSETPPALSTESRATLQMYAAHAPLRAPELANPDSTTNRQILQTMVQKALQRKATDAPPSNTDRNQ